jgi:hypothetical protein
LCIQKSFPLLNVLELGPPPPFSPISIHLLSSSP